MRFDLCEIALARIITHPSASAFLTISLLRGGLPHRADATTFDNCLM
jgi:hypothetical protein